MNVSMTDHDVSIEVLSWVNSELRKKVILEQDLPRLVNEQTRHNLFRPFANISLASLLVCHAVLWSYSLFM